MTRRAQRKERSRANALRRGEENAKRKAREEGLTELQQAAREIARREGSPAEPVRDGLLWLIRKGRLVAARQHAAAIYRDAYREPQEGAIASGLASIGVVSSGRITQAVGALSAGRTDALRRLHEMRTVALCGHAQMINVMDGVVGGGLTLREMAADDKHEAKCLECVLMIALDLVSAWSKDRGLQMAANYSTQSLSPDVRRGRAAGAS